MIRKNLVLSKKTESLTPSGSRFFSGRIMLTLDHFLILSKRRLHRVMKE